MTVLGTLELVSRIELTVKDKAAAHTRTYEKSDYILLALGNTVLILTENAYVNVVSDEERCTELLLDGLSDIVILPGKIR